MRAMNWHVSGKRKGGLVCPGRRNPHQPPLKGEAPGGRSPEPPGVNCYSIVARSILAEGVGRREEI